MKIRSTIRAKATVAHVRKNKTLDRKRKHRKDLKLCSQY